MKTLQAKLFTVVGALALGICDAPHAAAQGGRPLVNDCDRLAAHPDDPKKAVADGVRLIANIDSQRAIPACRAALAAHPETSRFHYQLGRALHKSKLYGEALAEYRKAADKGYGHAMNNIGLLYQYGLGVTQNSAEALQWFRKAAEKGVGGAKYNSAIMYLHGQGVAKDYDRAIADFAEAIRLDASIVNAYINRGFAYEKLGRKTDAIADFRKALLLDPGNKYATEGLSRLGAKPF